MKLTYSLGFVLLFFIGSLRGQSPDTTQKSYHFRGNISVTQNGMSLIPAFSLGKPAAIAELSIGGDKLSFDPEIRFDLNGQPWSFIFWWRYQFLPKSRFRLHAGAHPAFIFRNTTVMSAKGLPVESMEGRRFFAGEIGPSYRISDQMRVGGIFLVGRSLGKVPKEINQFYAIHTTLNAFKPAHEWTVQARPMAFYLQMNDRRGFFLSSSFLVANKNFPISLGSIVSRRTVSTIEVEDWIWNISLIYSFSNDFQRKTAAYL
ncbi:MAG: hypothetical protein ACK4LB_02900 [Spirosomataceae bacterium]